MSYNTRNYLWEAVASYVVNDYFTYIYNAAKSSTKNSSLTEAYQGKVELYIRGIKSVEQNYRRLCSDIHRFVNKSNRFSCLMYGEFVDKMVESFVPEDYYGVLNKQQKDEIFSSIINDLIANVGAFCVKSPTLRKIIDEHEKNKHITQDIIYRESLQILAIKKDELTHTFIKNIGQVKETVPMEVVNQYRKEVDEYKSKIDDLNAKISDLENENDEIVSEFKDKEQKFRKIIDYLQSNRITVERNKIAPVDKVSIDVQTDKPASPVTVKLTESNLKKHLQDPKNNPKKVTTILKDESESSSEIVQTHRNSYKKSLDSGKNEVVDQLEGLLLVDQHSDS